MGGYDTSIGGTGRGFGNTAWSMILAAGDPRHPRFHEYWERLLRAYWKPVYGYVRAAWKKSSEDAKDLTQSFFTHLLEKGTLSRLDPKLGSFRGYIKRALAHFLIDADRAQKSRSPSKPFFHIDAQPGILETLVPSSVGLSPDQIFDQQWSRCLFETAVRELEQTLKQDGKEIYFKVFQGYCLDPQDQDDPGRSAEILRKSTISGPTYRELGKRLKLHESDVRNYLRYCRTEFRRILRDQIREYVAAEGDVEAELKEVLKG